MTNLSHIMRIEFEEECGPYTFERVALFNKNNITEEDAWRAIRAGEYNPNVLVMTKSQWESVFQAGDITRQTPLSVDELKALPLRAWVWIEIPRLFQSETKTSAYYRKQYEHDADRLFSCGYPGLSFSFDYADYNKTWVAYSSQPKGAKNNGK